MPATETEPTEMCHSASSSPDQKLVDGVATRIPTGETKSAEKGNRIPLTPEQHEIVDRYIKELRSRLLLKVRVQRRVRAVRKRLEDRRAEEAELPMTEGLTGEETVHGWGRGAGPTMQQKVKMLQRANTLPIPEVPWLSQNLRPEG